ncbi:MAG: radical SAM protein [Candidatus Omnitrophica bacterium]|nr:radical SAM protein [Candidatus Omnitrophota bacterium]
MANLGYIQITRSCNQKCRFCSNPDTGETITLSQAKHYINDYAKRGYAGVFLTGGEPTLHPQLTEMIAYALSKNILPRLITNGQLLSEKKRFPSLIKSGLNHIMLSVYSYDNKVQAKLSGNSASLSNIKSALDNIKDAGITVDIITTINKYNASHLSRTAKWIVESYPFIRHFIWNNLDPLNNRAASNPDTWPKLNDFELELNKAMCFLCSAGKTFRVERVPLCYMSGFEHCSTETRKIVKEEERSIFFLDDKAFVKQKGLRGLIGYNKSKCCKDCLLDSICAGLYGGGECYSLSELYPVFIPKEVIINKILE